MMTVKTRGWTDRVMFLDTEREGNNGPVTVACCRVSFERVFGKIRLNRRYRLRGRATRLKGRWPPVQGLIGVRVRVHNLPRIGVMTLIQLDEDWRLLTLPKWVARKVFGSDLLDGNYRLTGTATPVTKRK